MKISLAGVVLGSCVFTLMLVTPCSSQVQRSGGVESQKIMQQYQQLAAEKTVLQAQLSQMKKDLDAATANVAAVTRERDALKARPAGVSPATITQLTAAKESAERSVELSKQRMTELVTHFRETTAALKDSELDRSKLRTELEARNVAFDRCAENNQQLYEINDKILDRYAHVGVFTRASSTEPFTQIERNRMDNLVVETRERADALRMKKRAEGEH